MDKILILDFGGQYNQLIARRVRECNVYCEVKPYTMPLAEIRAFAPKGIIFTGGPHSVYAADSPQVDPEIFALGLPILGICYGCQLMAQTLGGQCDRRVGSDGAGIWQDEHLFFGKLQALCRFAGGEHHLDEPRRLPGPGTGWLPACRPYGRLPHGGYRRREPGVLRRAVPSGGQSYGPRAGDAAQFPLCGLPVRPYLDDAQLYENGHRGCAGEGRRREGPAGAVRRCRFLCRGGAAGEGRRRAADLHFCRPRPAAQKRG